MYLSERVINELFDKFKQKQHDKWKNGQQSYQMYLGQVEAMQSTYPIVQASLNKAKSSGNTAKIKKYSDELKHAKEWERMCRKWATKLKP